MVEECSCEALEWSRLLELVASFVHSRVAREWLLGVKPSRDTTWIDQQHDLVGETRLLLGQGASPALGGLFDPTKLTDKARIEGALLEPEEIRDLLFLMDNITSWQALIALTAAIALRSMHGTCTRPAIGSQVRPRLCSIAISAAFSTWRGVPPITSQSPAAAIEQADPTSP